MINKDIHDVLTLEICKLQPTKQAIISCITEQQEHLSKPTNYPVTLTSVGIALGVGCVALIIVALVLETFVWSK